MQYQNSTYDRTERSIRRSQSFCRAPMSMIHRLVIFTRDAQDSSLDIIRDSMDGGGGGLCFPRGLGSLDKIESGSSDTSTAIEYSHSDTASETLRVIRDMRREMSDMQTELLALREQQRRARQPGPEARIPDHQEAF
ncbi:hypothetical protein Tco_0375166 [Tanacetum coccineum]